MKKGHKKRGWVMKTISVKQQDSQRMAATAASLPSKQVGRGLDAPAGSGQCPLPSASKPASCQRVRFWQTLISQPRATSTSLYHEWLQRLQLVKKPTGHHLVCVCSEDVQTRLAEEACFVNQHGAELSSDAKINTLLKRLLSGQWREI